MDQLGDLDVYIALEHCKCPGTCECDDRLACETAGVVDIPSQGC